MLLAIEILGYGKLCNYIAEHGSIKIALAVAIFIFIVGLLVDPILFEFFGFYYTAYNFMWSLILNGFGLIGSTSGVIWFANEN